MRSLARNLWALYELARLAWITRFRFSGAYWRWRMHTAFARGRPGRIDLGRAILAYGRWIHDMRRGTRG